MKVKRLSKQKLYVVYIASHNGEIYYVGHGVYGREKHVNSGCSHVYELNKMHFQGIKFEVSIEKFETKSEAAKQEEDIIKAIRPKLNKVFLTENNKIQKMRCLGEFKKFINNKALEFKKENKCQHYDLLALNSFLEMNGVANCILGLYTKNLNKKSANKSIAIINSLNKESKKSEFLAYFYTTDNSKGRWLAISNCILEDFENYLSVHKPEFIDEFSIILAQRKLEQE